MEIAPGVHLLEETKGSYVYVIMGQEPVLVDTFFPGKSGQVIAGLERIGLRPHDIAHILLTHSDVDHVGNAKRLQELSGAKLWAPREELPFIHGAQKDSGLRRVIKAMIKVDAPAIDDVYEAGMRIGGLEVIPSPGHTRGHVSLLYGDVLLAGDLVTTRRGRLRPSPGLLTWNKEALRRSFRHVGALPFDWVCPAHGEPVRRGALWEDLLNI